MNEWTYMNAGMIQDEMQRLTESSSNAGSEIHRPRLGNKVWLLTNSFRKAMAMIKIVKKQNKGAKRLETRPAFLRTRRTGAK